MEVKTKTDYVAGDKGKVGGAINALLSFTYTQ